MLVAMCYEAIEVDHIDTNPGFAIEPVVAILLYPVVSHRSSLILK